MTTYVSMHDLCDQLLVGLVKRIAGRVRASSSSHCDSCHDDYNEGYADYDKCWLDGERYRNAVTDELPWSLKFCCCEQLNDFEGEVKMEIKKREVAT